MQDRDDNIFDLDIRSILEGGKEEVPARVWENLSPRLEVMAEERRRRTFMRWMGRATAVAAVAASVTIAIVFPWGAEISVPSGNNDRIAVVEPEDDVKPEEKYIALAAAAEEIDDIKVSEAQGAYSDVPDEAVPSEIPVSTDETFGQTKETHEVPSEKAVGQEIENQDSDKSETDIIEDKTTDAEPEATIGKSADAYSDSFGYFPENERKKEPVKVSMTLSGNAMSNSKGKGMGSQPMRIPEMPGKDSFREEEESSYGIPLSFGIGTRIEFTPRWSMSIGVNYTLLSRRFKGTYTDVNGKATPTTSIVNSQSYIGIPVNVYFNIVRGDFVDFYAYAGGAMEKCVENKFALKDASPDIVRQKASGLQWSANIGLGAEFILTDWLGLYIDPSLRYYFNCGQPKSIRTKQPLSLGFELGFRFRL